MCSLKRLQRLWVFSLQKTVPFPFRELTVELDLTIINLSLFVCSNLNLFHACTFSSHPMSLLSSYIAPSCSLPHSIILYNFLLCMLFPTSSNGLPLILCNILLSYLNLSSYSFLLPILFPIFHHIQYHFSHPLILNVLYPLLLPLILAYFIPPPVILLCHFFSSYTTSTHLIDCRVVLSYFLSSYSAFYLLISYPIYSALRLFTLFTSYIVPACLLPLSLILHHLIYAISYVLSCFTTFSHPIPLPFPTYLDHIQCHFFSFFITSSHAVRLPLILSYFLSL